MWKLECLVCICVMYVLFIKCLSKCTLLFLNYVGFDIPDVPLVKRSFELWRVGEINFTFLHFVL